MIKLVELLEFSLWPQTVQTEGVHKNKHISHVQTLVGFLGEMTCKQAPWFYLNRFPLGTTSNNLNTV